MATPTETGQATSVCSAAQGTEGGSRTEVAAVLDLSLGGPGPVCLHLPSLTGVVGLQEV